VLERRRRNLILLNELLGPRFPERPGERVVPHAYPILLDDVDQRDRALLLLHARGVEARTFFSSIPTQEEAYAFLGHRRGEFPRAESIGERGLYVPCHQDLTEEDIGYLAGQILEVLASL
jgi:dTDP-4-amino-4,6-dideoxygalactose transaminase